MKVYEIAETIGLQLVSGNGGVNNTVRDGYVSDLLSDVMGNAQQGDIWVTLQTHKNIVAVASLKELAAIVIIGGNKPNPDAIEQSNNENIPMFITSKSNFEISGLLFQALRK